MDNGQPIGITFVSMKHLFKLTALAIAVVIFSGCGGDKEDPKPLSTSKLVGTWDLTSTQTQMTVDGKSLLQFYIDFGLSEEEAQVFVDIISSTLTITGFSAEMEFKNNYTWGGKSEAGDPTSGGWSLSSDEKTLTVTSDKQAGEQVATITKLTDTELTLEMDPGVKTQPVGAPGNIEYLAVIKFTRK